MQFHQKSLSFIYAFYFTFASTSCGPTEEEPQYPNQKAAQHNCNALVSNYCVQVSSCGEITQPTCEASIREQLDCSQAVDFDEDRLTVCLQDIERMTCEAGADLPASCAGVIAVK